MCKKICTLLLALSSIFFASELWADPISTPPVFRMHLPEEPKTLVPYKLKSGSNYLIGNLHRNLFIYRDQGGLQPDLAESCKIQKSTELICVLKKNLKWSDGTPLTSEDFKNTYLKILKPENAAPRADLLFQLKNAEKIYAGKLPSHELGVKTPNSHTLIFQFEDKNSDFEYHLSGTLLAPTKEDPNISSGPYKLDSWQKGTKITVSSNTHYHQKNTSRPVVEILFVEEDSIALQLYEKDQLSMLRRLPTLFIPKYRQRKDFVWVPLLRMDFVGLAGVLSNQPALRQQMTESLNYVELQKIFSSEGLPGCIGLPDSWFEKSAPCYSYKSRPAAKTSKDIWNLPTLPKMIFSAAGGEDHKRAAEWMQNQWQNNLNLRIHLEAKENKTFLEILQTKTPDIFRKGLPLDRPTCLAALETFTSKHRENYLAFQSPDFDKVVLKMQGSPTLSKDKKLCTQAINLLMNSHKFIPLGAMHFAVLINEKFTGWKINEMNQLDLSLLGPRL